MARIIADESAGIRAGDAASKDDWRTEADHFQRHRAAIGAVPFEQVEPAFQFGWDTGRDTRFQGRRWEEIEALLRSDWERRNPGGSWERCKDAIRVGWERTSGSVRHALRLRL